MAGVGRWPVPIPEKVKVAERTGRVTVQGPKGNLELEIGPALSVQVLDGTVVVTRLQESRQAKALHGLTRKLIANMVAGVSKGFSRTLEINGVGYRAEVRGNVVVLTLGYSHPIHFRLPPGLSAKVDRQVMITLEGADRELLGQAAAALRKLRPPEPYKAKGVKYVEERIRRKAGKAAGAAGTR